MLTEALGGHFSPHYTTQIDVLIAKQVGSEKYKVAMGLGTPVVNISWLEALMSDPRTASMDPMEVRA
jgi:hypothetical protein